MGRNNERVLFNFSGKGTVYSFTTLYPECAPEGFVESAPYTIALVELEEGPLVTAQLTDLPVRKNTKTQYVEGLNGEMVLVEREAIEPDIEIGDGVEMVTRRLREDGDERGLIVYGYKFRPVLTTSDV
jgi:uncharacterized OB-fold protein